MATGSVQGLSMRTLLRPGRHGSLVRLESRRGTRFVLAGPDQKRPRVFFDLGEAVRSFESVEMAGRQGDSQSQADARSN